MDFFDSHVYKGKPTRCALCERKLYLEGDEPPIFIDGLGYLCYACDDGEYNLDDESDCI